MKNQTQMLTYPSLFKTLVLDKAENTSQKIFRYGILSLAGSALIAICAQVSVPFLSSSCDNADIRSNSDRTDLRLETGRDYRGIVSY